MPVQFKKQRLDIPKGAGRKRLRGTFKFDSKVVSSVLVLSGFKLNFRKKDHHIDEIEIEPVNVSVIPPRDTEVNFEVNCRYEDKDANDSWDGYVDITVIAEVEGNLVPFGTLYLAPTAQ